MLLPCRLHAHCTDYITYIVMGTDNGVPIHYNTFAHLLHIAIYLDMHSFFLLNMLITFIFQNLHDDMWPWWKIWWILAISVYVHVLPMIFFLFQGKRQESVPIFFCYWFDFDQGMLMPWIGEILTKRNDELKIEYLKDCLIQVH